jgi:SPP1 gp7 family putative phage head morphogenesis protein
MIDPIIRRQLYLTQFANGEAQAAADAMLKMADDLAVIVSAGRASDLQISQLTALEAQITDTVNDAIAGMRAKLDATVSSLAPLEAKTTVDMIEGYATATLAMPSTEHILATVTDAPMTLISGKVTRVHTIASMMDEFDASTSRDVIHAIRSGVILGTPTIGEGSILEAVRDLVTTRTAWQSETVVRTAIAHIANVARRSVYEENADIFEGEEWVATLDGRTRVEHAALDGKLFPVGEGPQAPLGWNCRCVRVPVIKAGLLPEGFDPDRASIDGPVSGSTTYGDWLRSQSPEFQDDVLGTKRGQLFRDGAISINQFANKDFVSITIDQLAAKKITIAASSVSPGKKWSELTSSDKVVVDDVLSNFRSSNLKMTQAQKEVWFSLSPAARARAAGPVLKKQIPNILMGDIDSFNDAKDAIKKTNKAVRDRLVFRPASSKIPSVDLPSFTGDWGTPTATEKYVDLYHVTLKETSDIIQKDGFKATAPNQIQGFESNIKGTYGWASVERAAFEVERSIEQGGFAPGDLEVLHVRLPTNKFTGRLRPDEDFSLDPKEWKKSMEELLSVAVEGDLPAKYIQRVFK